MTNSVDGWCVDAALSFVEGTGETGLPNIDLRPETKELFLLQFKGMAPVLGFPDLSTILVTFELTKDLPVYEIQPYAHHFVKESAGRAGLMGAEVSILSVRPISELHEEVIDLAVVQFREEIDSHGSNPWGDEPV